MGLCLSVCVSVCLSVTRRDCIEMAARIQPFLHTDFHRLMLRSIVGK